MKPADDPHSDYKALVQRGYDQCADDYAKTRLHDAHGELDLIMERLGENSAVLDIGCGAGIPVTQALAKKYNVMGVDLSEKMIAHARTNVPEAQFILGDIMDIAFQAGEFDAVVSFYAIFHLPREEHAELFQRIYRWLKPEGYFLATLAIDNEKGYTEEDFFDVTMYWSNFGLSEYQQMLRQIGFRLLDTSVIGHGFHDDEQMEAEVHPLIFAQSDK